MGGTFLTQAEVAKKFGNANNAMQSNDVKPVQTCPNKNWIDLYYKYNSDRPVSFADYIILDPGGNKVASGKLDQNGFAHVTGLPDSLSSCEILYTSDPKPFEIFNDRKPIANPYQLLATKLKPDQNSNVVAAAAYEALAPALKVASVYHDLQAAAGEWVLGAIAGEWNEDQTVGQILFDSGLSLIPVVDQVADVRDACANLYQLTVKRRYKEFGPWFSLVLTVIGMIPEAGTVIKGAVKCVVRVGKDAAKTVIDKGSDFAEKLIKKQDIGLGRLIRYMNYFGEGNVVEWLRQLVINFEKHKKFVTDRIKLLLALFRWKCGQLRNAIVDKFTDLLSTACETVDLILKEFVDDFVPKIMERIKNWVNEVIGNPKDYSIKGSTKTQNGAQQIAEPPPLGPALARQKKRLEDIQAAAKRAGMEPEELKGLVKNSEKRGRRTVVRFTNDKALDFHGRKGYLPKNVDVKLKTAKEGPFAGLVVRPKGPEETWEEWERQNVRYLRSKGYDWDKNGVLVDKDHNRYYGDYDLQAVHRKVEMDGKEVYVSEISEPGVIDDINADMGRPGRPDGQNRPIQHGAENDFWVKTDEKGEIITDPKHGKTQMATEEDIRAGRATLGRQHGDDEKYLVVHPDGRIEILEDPDALYNMYRREGDELPWNYNRKPPTGEEFAAEQARRKAKREAYERMSVAEAEAEKTQMQSLIDDIIGDGNQFSHKAPTDDGPLPFFKDNSVNDRIGSSQQKANVDPGQYPW